MDAEALIQQFVDDRESLTELEIGLLVDAVADNPELLQSLHDQLVVDDYLSQQHAVDRARFESQVDQRIDDYLQGEQELDRRADELRTLAQDQMEQWRAGRSQKLWWGAAVAAVIALFALGVGVYAGRTIWQTVGFVASAAQGSMIYRGESEFAATEGERILVGDRIVTPAGGSLVFEYSDQTRVNLLGASSVVFDRFHSPQGGSAKRLHLQGGELFASVSPQQQPMRLETPIAQALVLGTELQLSARSDQTRLEVISGKVDLRRNSDGKTVTVAASQAAVASANSLAVAPVLWPSSHEKLLFQFQTSDKSAIAVVNQQNQPVVLQPFGNARWNHDYAMHFAGEPTLSASGGFRLPEAASQGVCGQLAQGEAVSIEAVITPLRSQNHGFILGVVDGETGLTIRQEGAELIAAWRSSRSREISLGAANSTQPTHVAVVLADDTLAAFVNGERRAEVAIETVSLSSLARASLAFGSSGGDGHWKGYLEGVAVYARSLGEAEIKTNARQYLRSIETRPTVPQCELAATLIRKSHAPSLADAAPHRAALQVNGFHVTKIERGNLYGDAKRLFAADWALLDGDVQSFTQLPDNTVLRLVVERVEDNPQIRPFFMADDFQTPADKNATRYLVVDHIVQPQ